MSEAITGATPGALLDEFDAIIIGTGAAGSMAALLLTEAGLRVLVLDAGTARAQLTLSATVDAIAANDRQKIQSLCYAWHHAPAAYVDDIDCPYVTPAHKPFVWIRARQLGGRLMVPGHGWQYYRMGPDDLAPVDGLSPPWPIAAEELHPWYAAVERRIGLAGRNDGLRCLPDSQLSRVLELTADEVAIGDKIRARWNGARPVVGRFAPPFDALEAAAATGRLLVRAGAIVREVIVGDDGHVRGAIWIDRDSRVESFAQAPVIFGCASALETTRLLLLSCSGRHPDGLGAASGALGRYLMDHVLLGAQGWGPQPQSYDDGRCVYLPRFDARDLSEPYPGRGFGLQVYRWPEDEGPINFIASSFAEMLPRPENRVTLDSKTRDAWGIPALHIECSYGEDELARSRDQVRALRDIAELADARLISLDEVPRPPGTAMHECGTARMGSDPDNSVLDPHNECWDARGLYVTDGACFPSQGTQNPTLTILALTARACAHVLATRGRA